MVSKKAPASPKGFVRTVFYLSPEERDAIASLAAELRVSESTLYREAVELYLERRRPRRKPKK